MVESARSSTSTRPAALRLTDTERDRLLSYGATVRAAVRRLLEIADEHEACPPVDPPPAPPAPVARHYAPPPVTYRVDRQDEEPLVTTDHGLAVRTAREHGTRVRRA